MGKPSKLHLLILEVLQENQNLPPNQFINLVSEKHRSEYKKPMCLEEYYQIMNKMVQQNLLPQEFNYKNHNPKKQEAEGY